MESTLLVRYLSLNIPIALLILYWNFSISIETIHADTFRNPGAVRKSMHLHFNIEDQNHRGSKVLILLDIARMIPHPIIYLARLESGDNWLLFSLFLWQQKFKYMCTLYSTLLPTHSFYRLLTFWSLRLSLGVCSASVQESQLHCILVDLVGADRCYSDVNVKEDCYTWNCCSQFHAKINTCLITMQMVLCIKCHQHSLAKFFG